MVKYPQTYPLIPKIPLGWSIKSKFWRIFKCTFMHVKYVVQRFVPRDLIFWSFAYCLTISESSCQPGSTGTQIWAQNSMVNQWEPSQKSIKKFCNFFGSIPNFFPTMAKQAPRWMFWAPEEKPMERALEHWKFCKNAFFSESNPQFFFHFWPIPSKT